MVSKIYDVKARVLDYIETTLGKYGPDKMDVAEMDKLADIVKDLSEAEKSCWEAEYYRSITEAMEGGSYGYPNGGYVPSMTYGHMHDGERMGYNHNRDSMGRYANGRRGYGSMGYHDQIDELREQMKVASPEEREKMKRELRQLADSK